MLEKPKNYQEARVIIENAVDDDLQTKRLKMAIFRLLLVVGAGVAASVTVGVKTNDLVLGVLAFAVAIIVAAPFTVPVILKRKVKDDVHAGTYFDDLPEDAVIEAATDYVREYNQYEEKHRKSR